MSRVFLDTNLFIYLVEDHGPRRRQILEVLERLSARHDDVMTSVLTLGEALVKPFSHADLAWADKFEKLLSAPGIFLIPFDRDCARIYAHIRQDRTIRAPDAIQLACAASAKCDLFLTNDERLSRKIVPGIQFISSLERSLLFI